ncbi:uncharacterized protein LOC109707361 isoform X2 [Ananas comosus]|uniref:Uncharacterized protein LOC109707361 isoform X2 n=1 Tax=Ananas comosus TaxID=4615 RepID=A0A6P5ESM5_ANACO|nr:uncharacterized protein LOC109707361 isoform X2 [Ananas comosus]
MIVRRYARRSRCGGGGSGDGDFVDLDPDSGDGAAGEFGDLLPISQSQESSHSHDRPPPLGGAFSSSQDSSPWSLDPDLLLPLPPIPDDLLLLPSSSSEPQQNLSKRARNPYGDDGVDAPRSASASVSASTATLMEAQEFGEMMEHVDEVNFALDGLRPGLPTRIRQASLLSLMSICGTPQQRRLLRAQGMAKRIIDAILGLKFDDNPSTVAAAAVFYALASDVEDDHLLDSPSCIRFLLKLLNPSTDSIVEDKAPTIGCRLLGIRMAPIPSGTNKGTDSTSRQIFSKVQKILQSSKEIKLLEGNDDGTGRLELSPRWIALLTMEKACLSAVSFEDTCDIVGRVGGNFKERLRELGGLDVIFNVLVSCYTALEGLVKDISPSISVLKEGVSMQSVILLLKCLKIMENATFLSNNNQNHLLRMNTKLESNGLPQSFVGVVLSTIKLLSVLADSSNVFRNDKELGPSSIDYGGCYNIDRDSMKKSSSLSHKRKKLLDSPSGLAINDSEMTVYSGSDISSGKKNFDCTSSISCNGTLSGLFRDSYTNGNGLKAKINANGAKVNAIRSGWISIKARGVEKSSSSLTKKPRMSEDVKDDFEIDSFDPFAFDEGDTEPSKWELLAMKNEPTRRQRRTVAKRELADVCELPIAVVDRSSSQLTNEENHLSGEPSCPSGNEDTNLLEDCLLTSVKVLMNLTNDNPVGCQQIAACGGLDTMVSLIVQHIPSFDLCFPENCQFKETISACQSESSSQNIKTSHVNNRHLSDHELDFLVAILGLLVNLVEKDSQNRLRLASACVSVDRPGQLDCKGITRDVIPLLCSIFLANQGAREVAGEDKDTLCEDEDYLLQGEREAEMMIIEAYAALLLAFLSTESVKVREAIASCLPNNNLQVLVPVLERFVAFHLTLNMISPETHSAVKKVIESCKEP